MCWRLWFHGGKTDAAINAYCVCKITSAANWSPDCAGKINSRGKTHLFAHTFVGNQITFHENVISHLPFPLHCYCFWPHECSSASGKKDQTHCFRMQEAAFCCDIKIYQKLNTTFGTELRRAKVSARFLDKGEAICNGKWQQALALSQTAFQFEMEKLHLHLE